MSLQNPDYIRHKTDSQLSNSTVFSSIIVQAIPGNFAIEAKAPLVVPHPLGQTLTQRDMVLLTAHSKPIELKLLLNDWSVTHKRNLQAMCKSCNGPCTTL